MYYFRKSKGKKIKLFVIVLLSILTLQSCFKNGYVSEDSFIGKWQLEGREIYNGMTIQIKNTSGQLKGYVIDCPNNQYGKSFLKEGDIWITDINRCANYYFKLKEQKIGNKLLSQYEIKTTSEFYITFSENKDTIFLLDKRPNRILEKSKIYYKKLKE